MRELISADLDGELADHEAARLDNHLTGCHSCRSHRDRSAAMHREFRLHASSELADIASPRLSIHDRVRTFTALQLALLVIGSTLIALNAADLVSAGPADRHLTRHEAVFGAALGVGMVSVAWQPQRARGLVPITSAIAALMMIVAVADLAAGRASFVTEALHLLEFTGLACLWVLSGGPARLERRRAGLRGSLRRLTAS